MGVKGEGGGVRDKSKQEQSLFKLYLPFSDSDTPLRATCCRLIASLVPRPSSLLHSGYCERTTMVAEFIQVLTTTDSRELAEKIGRALVERRLAACAQIAG